MIPHIRGATFQQSLILPDSFGATYFDGATVAAQLRTRSGALVADLVATWDGQQARVLTLRCTDTRGWPVGAAEFDVRFTLPTGDVVYTERTAVLVKERITE